MNAVDNPLEGTENKKASEGIPTVQNRSTIFSFISTVSTRFN
jgi:hypothetical protein